MEEIKLPKMGQSVEEAEIVQWFKNEGDTVEIGEPIFSILTDKAEIDYESPVAGVLRKQLIDAAVEVPVLTVVALIGGADEELPDLGQYAVADAAPAVSAAPADTPLEAASSAGAVASAPVTASNVTAGHVSPRARQRAAILHIDPTTLGGSGAGGRVTEQDVNAYAATLDAARISPAARRIAGAQGLDVQGVQGSGPGGRVVKADLAGLAAVPSGAETNVPLSPMRKVIAQRMAESKFSAPHYYVTVEVDMDAARDYRAGLTEFKASYNDLILYAVSRTLAVFPKVNAKWMGDSIVEGGDVNLGVAVALPEGLVVPVLRNADRLSLRDIAASARSLAERAQAGKLMPDDYKGNSFTISNLGAFGVDQFTAIINQPDSAILAVGQMKDRPAVINGGIHVRPLMKLTLSSDHRVIDGAVAAQFLGKVRERLEQADFGDR